MSHWSEMNRRSQGIADRKEDSIFEEMEYRRNSIKFAKILAEGNYRGVHYYVVSLFTHPVCRVVCSEEFLKKHKFTMAHPNWYSSNSILDCDIDVHGGVSYAGELRYLVGTTKVPGQCFAWNYSQPGDWDGSEDDYVNESYNRKKYTTETMVIHCKKAIDQYLAVLEEDKKQSSNQ